MAMLKGFIKSSGRDRKNAERESIKRWSVAEQQEAEQVCQELVGERYAFATEELRSDLTEKQQASAPAPAEGADEKLQQLLQLGCDHFTT
jgi:hypothetical protein